MIQILFGRLLFFYQAQGRYSTNMISENNANEEVSDQIPHTANPDSQQHILDQGSRGDGATSLTMQRPRDSVDCYPDVQATVDSEVTMKTQRLRQQRNELHQRCQALQKEQLQSKKAHHDLRLENERVKAELEKHVGWHKKLKREGLVLIKDAERQALNDQISSMKTSLAQKRADCDKFESLWREAVAEIEDLTSAQRHVSIDDDKIISSWNHLVWAIKDLVSQRFDAKYIPHKDDQNQLVAVFDHFGLNCNPPLEAQHLQALIWRFLYDDFLYHPSSIWGDGMDEVLYGPMKNHLSATEEGKKEYHNWRSDTAQLCNKRFKINEKCIQTSTAVMTQHIGMLLSSHDKLENDLREIANKAAKIALLIAQAKPYYRAVGLGPCGPTHSQDFDKSWMEMAVPQSDPTNTITMVMSPALVKYGNADGEDYNSRTIAVKAKVC